MVVAVLAYPIKFPPGVLDSRTSGIAAGRRECRRRMAAFALYSVKDFRPEVSVFQPQPRRSRPNWFCHRGVV